MPSRYNNNPKRIHESTSNAEQKRPRASSSGCKYDLGLGKNRPIQTNKGIDFVSHPTKYCRESLQPKTPSVGTLNEKKNTDSTTYDACRFLVEHEATRMYPDPNERRAMGSGQGKIEQNLANAIQPTRGPTTKRISAGIASSCASNRKQTICDFNDKHLKSKATRTNAAEQASVPIVSKRAPKAPRHAKVEPKRCLEDCLTILDHDMPNASSSSAAASVPTNSTIWSRPDAPQLDMNSVWVEMLLHNQMAHSQSQG